MASYTSSKVAETDDVDHFIGTICSIRDDYAEKLDSVEKRIAYGMLAQMADEFENEEECTQEHVDKFKQMASDLIRIIVG